MSSRYLDMVRRSQRGRAEPFTAKSLLALVAFVSMVASAVYWWGVQRQLTDNTLIALAFTAILVLAPPALTTFVIPWSPGGMLLQKINARTWGYMVVISAALYLIYYSFEIQYSWWDAQPNVKETGLVMQQVIVGIIGFIVIPALLWAPVSSEELMEQVRQAHLVKRYELQTQADIAILRDTLLRAQELTVRGLSNLNYGEQQELGGILHGVVHGIEQTLQEIGSSVKAVSNATIPFTSLYDNADVRSHLDYVTKSLMTRSAPPEEIADDMTVMERAQVRMAPLVGASPVARSNASERVGAFGAPTQGNAGQRRATQGNATLIAAQNALPPAWTVKQLAEALGVDESTARPLLTEWRESGVVQALKFKGSYSFCDITTESEA